MAPVVPEPTTSIELVQPDETPAIDTTATRREDYPTGAKLVLTIIALSLSIFLVALDSTIVATAIPSITSDFKSVKNIVWYSTAYSLSNTAFKLVWGKAYACFPLKQTWMFAMAVFEAGNIICALAQSSTAVIVGRLVSGLGGGGVMVGSFVIMALSAPPRRRPMMMAVTSVTFGCASVAGICQL
jgi:MFS family permease